jgi:predicted DNA-binding transcriptional regulator YafY
MARGDQLSRQWTIIQTLVASTYGKTAAELAVSVGCNRRTIYRDLEALQSGGFPLTTESRGNRSYWQILNPDRQKVPPAFSLTEMMALYFGKDMLNTYRGTFLYDAIESLSAKIKATLPPACTQYLDRIKNRMDSGPAPRKDYARSGPVIADLNRAIVDERQVRMAYFTMGRQTQSRRTVHPYGLRHVEDTLYLIAYCTSRKAVRTFAVDRIDTVEVTAETFTMPDAFNVQAFLKDSFGIYQGPPVTVRIRFRESVAGYIRERIWHPSQQLIDQPDGSVIFKARVAGIEEISHWVLRWGAGAQVLEPVDLRRRIRQHAERMAAYYRSPAVDSGPQPVE